MEIKEKTIMVPKRTVIKPARIEQVDTGVKREEKIIDADGKHSVRYVSITEPVFREAEFKDEEIPKKVFTVPDGDEEHEFATHEDATRFINDTAQNMQRKPENGNSNSA